MAPRPLVSAWVCCIARCGFCGGVASLDSGRSTHVHGGCAVLTAGPAPAGAGRRATRYSDPERSPDPPSRRDADRGWRSLCMRRPLARGARLPNAMAARRSATRPPSPNCRSRSRCSVQQRCGQSNRGSRRHWASRARPARPGADLGVVESRRRERRPTPSNNGSDRIRALEVVIDAIDRARTVGVTQETIASEMDNFAHTTDRTKDDLA